MSQFEYVKETFELPFAGDFKRILEVNFVENTEQDSHSSSQINAYWLAYLHEQFFIDIKQWDCTPVAGMPEVLERIVADKNAYLLVLTPFDYPEFLDLTTNNPNVHLLHTSAENHWKVSAEQLEAWCIEHASICTETFVYLPQPVSGLTWKAGELKRLAEIAKRYELCMVREASMQTPAEESFFHFLPNSSWIYINPYKGFEKADWQFGYLMEPKRLQAKRPQSTHSNSKVRVLNHQEIGALWLWMENLEKQVALLKKWETVLQSLRKEVSELLQAGRLIISPGNQHISMLLNFEKYRVTYGRMELFSMDMICAEIEKGCGVRLQPGTKLGFAPNTLVAVMYLSNIDALDWLEATDAKVDATFLYKRFWNCIDGAQKLMKYLNTLP